MTGSTHDPPSLAVTETIPHIQLFVYGTLMRGGRYHDQFCSIAVDIQPATITGRLYDLDAGYPTLEIPEAAVLARGTGDPVADADTANECPVEQSAPGADDGWDRVHGELILFSDPKTTLPRIDALEEFVPGRSANLYERVLGPVDCGGERVAAWLYVGSPALIRMGRRIADGVWSGPRER